MYCRTNNFKIYYNEEGHGLPVFVIHGGMGMDCAYFGNSLSPLYVKNQIVYFDLPFNGKTITIKHGLKFNIELVADELECFFNKYLSRKRVLLAHSYGGYLGLVWALKFSKPSDKIILVNPVILNEYWNNEKNKKAFNMLHSNIKNKINKIKVCNNNTMGEYVRLKLPLYFYSRAKYNEYKPIFDSIIWRYRTYIQGCDELNKADRYLNMYNKIKAEVLIIHGKHDNIIPSIHSDMLSMLINNSKDVLFKNSGHFPFFEEQELFANIVSKYINYVE